MTVTNLIHKTTVIRKPFNPFKKHFIEYINTRLINLKMNENERK